jgi:predicted aconitase with swiveling domain
MSTIIPLRGRGLVKGVGSGTAVVTKEAISFLGGVDSKTGVIVERGHKLQGTIRLEDYLEKRRSSQS